VSTISKICDSIDQKLKELIQQVSAAISTIGNSRLHLVGGFVRDSLLGKPSKDIDFVVCNMPFGPHQVEEALKSIVDALSTIPGSKVKEVGKSFGIVKATISGEDFDFALPRAAETKTGEKHTDFAVELDPSASIVIDLFRRDFTMNAIAFDMEMMMVMDPHGGIRDIENGVIRAVGVPESRFVEDPLRMMRAIQFASRFGFEIEPNTWNSLVKNAELIKTVSGERIFEEIKKAFAKSNWKNDFNLLMMRSGMAKFLFGDFAPFAVMKKLTGDELIEVQFVALFSTVGDFSVLKLPNNLFELITLFRNVVSFKFASADVESKEPWEFVGSLKHKLHLVSAILPEFTPLIDKMIATPLTVKELVVTGGDLLAAGFKGKQIGEAQRKMLSLLWKGEVSNTKEELFGCLQKV
jgi:tRNA nucleotidyltransferase/poly(A) polymerase